MSGITSSAFAAGYLKIGDIKGEATDRGHKDWIEVESIRWGDASGASSAGPVRDRPGSVSVVKTFDKATPKLNEACTTGKSYKSVRLHVLEDTSGQKTEYIKYVLPDVIISSCSVGGGDNSESFSLNYEQIRWTYDKGAKDRSTTEGILRKRY